MSGLANHAAMSAVAEKSETNVVQVQRAGQAEVMPIYMLPYREVRQSGNLETVQESGTVRPRLLDTAMSSCTGIWFSTATPPSLGMPSSCRPAASRLLQAHEL